MVHIDAHTDTWGEFFGSKFTHGAPFRLAVEAGVLDPKRTIQIGIRGGQNFMDGIEFSRSHGMRENSIDRKSTRLNSSHRCISYAVFCLKKKRRRSRRTLVISSTVKNQTNRRDVR